MRILFALTYYRPHISGLTIYVERLAGALAQRGHQVTVLTSHYERDLPFMEIVDGVKIVRAPVLLRVSKGCIMPTFPWLAYKLMRESDVVSVHLPQFEGGLLACLGRFLVHRKVVLTYHCDLELPPGLFNWLADKVISLVNLLAGRLANRIVSYTEDYARHSPFLSRFRDRIEIIYPPVEITEATEGQRQALRRKLGLSDEKVVGFAARFAAEKGVEYLIGAIPHILPRAANLRIVCAGEYQRVFGEDIFGKLRPLIDRYRDHLTFLGVLPPDEMASFFGICDCLVVASVNSTESFGLVQVEAMLCGTPVVATDLPGVRQPVRLTGMGELVPPRDERALAEAIIKVIENRSAYLRPRHIILQTFDFAATVEQYEKLFEALKRG